MYAYSISYLVLIVQALLRLLFIYYQYYMTSDSSQSSRVSVFSDIVLKKILNPINTKNVALIKVLIQRKLISVKS